MGRLRAFTVGWYGHHNLGDEAFKPAICKLFPEVDFSFGDCIPKNINEYDFMLVGGGSFLEAILPNPGKVTITIPIGFIGVGLSEALHKSNKELLAKAKLVLVRDSTSTEFWPTAVQTPDLVFNIPMPYRHNPVGKKVTILVNDFITPDATFPDWKFISYYWFLCEFGEVCNDLIDDGYTLQFLPMGIQSIDDRRCAAAVVGRIRKKNKAEWVLTEVTSDMLQKEISESEFVITMRFHGMVYSAIIGTPFICIHTHDKMVGLAKDMNWKGMANYYGFTKSAFNEALTHLENKNVLDTYAQEATSKWQSISVTTAQEFYQLVLQTSSQKACKF